MKRDYEEMDREYEDQFVAEVPPQIMDSEDADLVLNALYAVYPVEHIPLQTWLEIGNQPRVYLFDDRIPQPIRLFYQRFLDLLQIAFPPKKDSLPINDPLSARTGIIGRSRNKNYRDNVDVVLTVLGLFWKDKFRDNQYHLATQRLQDILINAERVTGRQLQIHSLTYFNSLLVGFSVIYVDFLQDPQIFTLLQQDRVFLPSYQYLAKWLNMQQNQVVHQLGILRQGRSIQDIKRFSNRLFTLPFDTLSPGNGDIFDINAIVRTSPTIPGTMTGFFMMKSHVPQAPDSFTIDFDLQDSIALEIFCLLTYFPYMVYSFMPWLVRKVGQLLNAVSLTDGIEQRHMRKIFFRQPIVTYLTTQRHVVKKYLFQTQNRLRSDIIIENIQKANSFKQVTFILIKHLKNTTKILSRNLLRTIRGTQGEKLQNYIQKDQDQKPVLTLARVHLRGPVLPFQAEFMYQKTTAEYGYIFRKLAAIFNEKMRKTTILLPRFDWTFYGRKKLDFGKYAREEIQGECVEVVNSQLEMLNLPTLNFVDKPNPVDYLEHYCIFNEIDLEVVGFRQRNLNYNKGWCIRASPRHIQIFQGKAKSPYQRVSNIAANYQGTQKAENFYCFDNSMRNRPTPQTWVIGDQLPFDPQIDQTDQKMFRRRCILVDIQALAVQQTRQTPYMICVMGYLSDSIQPTYMCFSNTELEIKEDRYINTITPTGFNINYERCIQDFCQWLARISYKYTSQDPLYIWGFNAMRYQITYLLPELTRKFGKVEPLGQPSQCRSFSVCQGAIVFADILKILTPDKLIDLTKQFEIVIRKQDFQIALVKTWDEVKQKYQTIKQYCYYDCVSSLLLLHKIQVIFCQIAKKLHMPYTIQTIRRKLTASSIGWYFFVQKFFQQNIRNNNKKPDVSNTFFNDQPKEVYNYQRKSFSGGIVQVWRHYYKGKIFVVDINSMYPAMLSLYQQPWIYIGEIQNFKNYHLSSVLSQSQSDLYLYKVRCYRLPVDFLGAFIPTKQIPGSSKNTYYNDYQGDDLFLRGVAIKRILHHKGTVYVERVWRYSSGGVTAFKQFAQVFYKMRCEQKKNSLKTCIKLIMNSVIGRCSMKQHTKCSFTPFPLGQTSYRYDQNVFLNIDEPLLPAVGRLVRLTSMVTQQAHCYLDMLAEKAEYQNVLYCDTDSLIVTQQGYRRLGSPPLKASRLGDFKCQIKNDNSENYYIQGFFKNRKDYILKYISTEGEIKYLHKAKGIPKKYITSKYSEEMSEAIKAFSAVWSTNLPVDIKYPIGPSIEIKVWNRQFSDKGGVTIKSMWKQSSVITDRVFYEPHGVGYPRSPNSFIILGEQEDQ